MLKSFADKVNNTISAVNWLKSEFPDDEIVFASAATATETKSVTPVRWYQQILERYTTLVITKNQLVLKNNLVSPVTVFYAFVLIASVVTYLVSKDWQILLLVPLALLHIWFRLPYERQLPYTEIRKVMLDSRSSARTELIIDMKEKVIHTVFAQTLPQKAWKVITSRTKTVIYS